MKRSIPGLLALAASAALTALPAQAADPIKPGKWEFVTRLQVGAAQAAAAGAGGVTYSLCIDTRQPVPSDPRPECKTEQVKRTGDLVTWETSCTRPVGTVASAGSARYSGDTMQGSMNTRAPNGSGGYIVTTQHITGHYLGPCAGK